MPEILAPAGDMERLKSAIKYGADAVYLGGSNFNARNSAANFSDEELKEVLFNNGCIYPKNMRVSPETKEYCCIEFYDDEKTYGRIYLKRKNGHHVL